MKENNPIQQSNINELLTAYYQGKLTSGEAKNLEQLAIEDDFVHDAMQGFDEFPEAINQIPSFSSKNKTGYKWMFAIGGIALLISAWIIFKPTNQTNQHQALSAIQLIDNKQELELAPIQKVIAQVESESEQKKLETKELIPKVIKEKPVSTVSTEVNQKREEFEIPRMALNPIELEQKATYTLKRAKTKAIGFYTFLAVDYSKIYSNSIPVSPTYTGTDASFANKHGLSVDLSDGSAQATVSYKTFLKQSLYLMKNKEYTKAIENFKVILTHFPGDVNAEFYTGYALFYQAKYDEAIAYFNKAIVNPFDFFLEDAEWFKANSLQKLGKIKEAQVLYNAIKEKGGYYSYQVK